MLRSVSIPGSVTSIGIFAFDDCTGLSAVTIPNSVTSIGDWAFRGCTGLVSITVDKENSRYADIDGVLFDKDIETIIKYPAGRRNANYTIPNSVTTIGGSAFAGCTGLSAVTIPSSVTTIGESAFSGCTGLIAVTIPGSVTTIGDRAFFGCTKLRSVQLSKGTSIRWQRWNMFPSKTEFIFTD
jgi:hypothetical protein